MSAEGSTEPPPRIWLAAWLGYPLLLSLGFLFLAASAELTSGEAARFMFVPLDRMRGPALLAFVLIGFGLVKCRSLAAITLGVVGCVLWVFLVVALHGLLIT